MWLLHNPLTHLHAEWEEAYTNLREKLGLSTDEPIPPIPRFHKSSSHPLNTSSTQSTGPPDAKRKAPDEDADIAMIDADELENRSKLDPVPSAPPTSQLQTLASDDVALRSAKAAAAFIPFLSPEELLPPKLPTKTEMENVLLGLRKQALLDEYFDEE